MQINKTFERLKKMISKGLYERESILLDINDFLEMGTIDDESYSILISMVDSVQLVRTVEEVESIKPISNSYDTVYQLIKKQITKQVYSKEVIEQMLTDFRITSTISRSQFVELRNLMDSLYNPQPDYVTEENVEDSI